MTNELERYYSGIVSAKRAGGPTMAEAAKDFARANATIFTR